ncbi:hypothetical protein BWZ22_04840 [Seonamhaeicola sp. S2-3]|uniref:DUF2383 domain-containing protein n=1 Tax=Seonamhaeicola sp. S2-3 TaxID=1936081 RepID=UPI0009727FE7|nr:DUF2383 domain-containing protein [Seonamhaeicola sp. S2-3]APY10604.1 hypothetical protein BWZ22_04840 [Seonamhaeicola sp. S2-3]
MKRIDNILEKLNDLLILNEEIENAYTKAINMLTDSFYKQFSNERSLERSGYVKSLKNELHKLEKKAENPVALKRRDHVVRLNFRNFLKIEDENKFLRKVYDIELLSVQKYDELLTQMNMPLSLCKLLLKHRDNIQARLFEMERDNEVIIR